MPDFVSCDTVLLSRTPIWSEINWQLECDREDSCGLIPCCGFDNDQGLGKQQGTFVQGDGSRKVKGLSLF